MRGLVHPTLWAVVVLGVSVTLAMCRDALDRDVGFKGCLGKPFTVDGLKRALTMAQDGGLYFSITAD